MRLRAGDGTQRPTMKVWELMAQLQGRDPSGEVVLTLAGADFKYVACFDLTPPANRQCIIEADPEDIGIDLDAHQQEIDQLCETIEDLTSALEQLIFALDRKEPLDDYLSNAREVLATTQTKTPSLNGR